MKKRGLICLLLCALLLSGCAKETVLEKAEQTLPIPNYPLREDAVLSAFTDAGYGVVLDSNDTEEASDRSSIVLRDKEKTTPRAETTCSSRTSSAPTPIREGP